jgi:hypothetical protein
MELLPSRLLNDRHDLGGEGGGRRERGREGGEEGMEEVEGRGL